MNLDDLIERYRSVDLDAQKISWKPEMWQRVWDDTTPRPAGREALRLIAQEVEANGTIRRSWLRQLADGDPIVFLVATTIWGFGSYNRGPRFLRAMLTDLRSSEPVGNVVASIVEASRTSPGDGFRALFAERGRTRVSHLGIAFGTKIVHFGGYDHADVKPLVLDLRVWTASGRLDEPAPVPNPKGYTTGDMYQAYCEWAGEVAARHRVEAAVVEYALFEQGARRRR